MARKKKGHAGGHGWFVTFADLMGLLMAFFVVVAAFSTQDKEKLMALLGSMREAFGSTRDPRLAGMIEIDGVPVRDQARHVSVVPATADSFSKSDGGAGHHREGGSSTPSPHRFDGAAASIRQALRDMPEVANRSVEVVMRQDETGLLIELIDHDGQPMFPAGSDRPYTRVVEILEAVAPVLGRLPHRVTITGHTASSGDAGGGVSAWDLSTDRAQAIRRVLENAGLRRDRIASVTGRADTDPYFSEAALSANRRVSLHLVPAAPPLPPGFGLPAGQRS